MLMSSASSVLGTDFPEKEQVRVSEVETASLRLSVLARLMGGGRIDKVPSSSSELFGLAPRLFLRPSSGVDLSAQCISSYCRWHDASPSSPTTLPTFDGLSHAWWLISRAPTSSLRNCPYPNALILSARLFGFLP